MNRKSKSNERKQDDMLFREAAVEAVRADEKAEPEVRASISSEIPYVTYVYDRELGTTIRAHEVLGHAEGEIDWSRMKDGLVIQDTHWGDQIGLMRHPEVRAGDQARRARRHPPQHERRLQDFRVSPREGEGGGRTARLPRRQVATV